MIYSLIALMAKEMPVTILQFEYYVAFFLEEGVRISLFLKTLRRM